LLKKRIVLGKFDFRMTPEVSGAMPQKEEIKEWL